MFSPGGFELVDGAISVCSLPEKSKILDVGCGDGEVANHLAQEYGYVPTGLDISLSLIEQGKEKYPDLDLRFGDGEFLDDFSSFTFDGVFMGCSLSLINLPDEALHEAFCVMKKGGYLIITDLYRKNPEPGQLQALKIEAERAMKKPHEEGDCDDPQPRQVSFRLDGAFFIEPLIDQLSEIGFKVVSFEDKSPALDTYVAETMLNEGSLDKCITDIKDRRNVGYFCLVAQKSL